MFLEKIREVEGGVIMNCPVSGRENFGADPFLDGKPVKLPKNGSDVICFCCCFAFYDSSCSGILHCL